MRVERMRNPPTSSHPSKHAMAGVLYVTVRKENKTRRRQADGRLYVVTVERGRPVSN